MRSIHVFSFTLLILICSVVVANVTFADDSVVDEINITVPVSCTMSGTGMNSHNAEISNGTYQANIGTTTLHAFCNDSEGFAIYAAGYTGDEIGETNSNKLVGTSASGNATIITGTATTAGTPDVSNWAMKLAITQDSGDTTGTNALTIDSDTEGTFSSYHTIPNTYTKVAHKNSATNMDTTNGGAKLTTTYAAYISKTQPADTYSGQVIYTLVHPSDHAKPIANPATLDTGKTVNPKLKSLAATVVNGEDTTAAYDTTDNYIKSIEVHLETPAPAGFTPTEKNTISTSTSKKPVYIVFDNTNDAGIMHFYTEGDQIALPPDSSYMFYYLLLLSEISGISDWDTSNVTNMRSMFSSVGSSATTFTLDLSSWNTSNVTDMLSMFYRAGFSATTFTLDLSSWNTSNVTYMDQMFYFAGYSATTFTLDISSWNTSSVTSMSYMFSYAGYSATTWSIGNLSSWNTSNVTDMGSMFYRAGCSATTFTLDLSSWNTSNVTRMNDMFYTAGFSATTFTLDLSSWNTSNVTYMNRMFYNAGDSATTWSVTIPQTNGNSINNTTSRLYGKTTSTYVAPPSGKSFTFAQP